MFALGMNELPKECIIKEEWQDYYKETITLARQHLG